MYDTMKETHKNTHIIFSGTENNIDIYWLS